MNPVHRENYPRVSTILSHLSKDGLDEWKLSMMKRAIEAGESPGEAMHAAKRYTQKAADMGTEVHDAIESNILGKGIIFDGGKDHLKYGLGSWLKWKEERNFKSIATELPVFSDKHGYRGTLDSVGRVDGKLAILDWKTSNSIRDEYRLQASAYYYALKEMCMMIPEFASKIGLSAVSFDVDQVRIVQVSKKEVKYRELIVDGEKEISIDFNAFLAAKRIYDWRLKRS